MRNKAMQRKIDAGDCIDVSAFANSGPYFVIPADVDIENKDLCHAPSERWIWSCGRRYCDGVHLASFGADLYQNPAFECTWLR